MCRLIVFSNSVRAKGFSYKENQMPFNKDFLVCSFTPCLLIGPVFRVLVVLCIIEGIEEVRLENSDDLSMKEIFRTSFEFLL